MILDLSSDDEKFDLKWMQPSTIKSIPLKLEIDVVSVFDDYRDWFYTEEDKKNFPKKYVRVYSVHRFEDNLVHSALNIRVKHEFPIYEQQNHGYVYLKFYSCYSTYNDKINYFPKVNYVSLNFVDRFSKNIQCNRINDLGRSAKFEFASIK